MRNRSFLPLFSTNFISVLNDNFLKTFASFMILSWLNDEKLASLLMGGTAAALVMPYVLCSPLSDRLTAICAKRRIVRLAKWAEIPIVLLAVAGFHLQSVAMVIASILLLGLQSSMYSPAKYALVRDIGGEERISTGMGGMEGVAFAAVLAGTIAASFAASPALGGFWIGGVVLIVFAVLGLAFSYTIRADEERNRHLHSINPVRYLRRAYRMAANYPGLNATIVTLSVFWWTAAMLQQGLLVYCKQVLNIGSVATGCILALAAIGIVIGQVLAGFIDKRRFLLGANLPTGLIAGGILLALFLFQCSPILFSVLIFILAFDLGFFKLPLDTEIQKTAKGPKLNTMLAYFNQVSFLFMFAASIAYIAVSWLFGPKAFLLLLALTMLLAPLIYALRYRKLLLFTGKCIFARRYRITVDGEMPTPPAGATLILPNHPAMVDPMLVVTELWKLPISPLVDEAFFHSGRLFADILKTMNAVEVPDLRLHRSQRGALIARGLDATICKALATGDNILLYPSGHIYTENREDLGTRQLAYNVCRALPANSRVVALRTNGLWGSIWSRSGRKSSPPLVSTLLKSVCLWLFAAPFTPRRHVTMHFEDITAQAREWAALSRLEFNSHLTDWYNQTNQ